MTSFTPNINPFKIPHEILQILPKLDNLENSQLFIEIWKRAKESSKNLTTDTFCVVIWEIWIHAIENWGTFYEELKTGDISVESLENLIQVFEENYDEIEKELMFVLKDKQIVKKRIDQLKHYRIMNSCQKASNELLQIKRILGLTDTFEICLQITRLACSNKTLMKEISPNALDMDCLQNIKTNEIRCLEEFRKAEPMIKWLKETMKEGLRELKVFIDLAFISAGEGDYEIDKMNCFHAVTYAFAPLIFDLKQDSSFDEVMKKCDLVWKELQNDKNLPQELRDTNKELEWFKVVRQSHGSVEVTTLKQAEQIVAHGIYEVGFPKDKTSKTELEISKVITLNVPQLHDEREYTYSNLMDLQSRLMLVGGQTEKGNENIERFTAVSL
ncbi:hypothetical protein SNE40_020742 [Patella caerulea]|uniref:Uncharacterized protein n=1 Tax=Patella caerulea TaxID=87958 RepID=A0AAN8P7N1_PATCE